MTPCEKLGYKVGDKFEVVREVRTFKVGSVVQLSLDDGTDKPMFRGEYNNWYMDIITDVKPLAVRVKLTKSKQWLADAIHNHGAGWPDGAKWAVQNGASGKISFSFNGKPKRDDMTGWYISEGGFKHNFMIAGHKPQPNWHQTVLSRDEYFSTYPEVIGFDVGSGKDETVAANIEQHETLDTLMKRWEDAKATTQEAIQAEREAHAAVSAELKRRGWNEEA